MTIFNNTYFRHSTKPLIYATLILLCVAFNTLTVHASVKNTTLTGVIICNDGESAAGVIVALKNADNKTIAYTTAKEEGRFILKYPADISDAIIYFSGLGYKQVSIPLQNFKNGDKITIDVDSYTLDEVTVKVAPIASKGDTLTYNVGAFKSANDKTIEDVIKKLPGIKISDSGQIFYNGESINKFYIEGLDLLAGKYSLASKNISPDDVVSINVFENHQEKRVLKNVEFSNKAALNLNLKKKSMLRPIGYLKAGVGTNINPSPLGLTEGFGLIVSPKIQTIFSAKCNNAGISYTDEYTDQTSGNSVEILTASKIYPDNPFGKPNIPATRYDDNRALSTSANILVQLSKFENLGLNADFSNEKESYSNSQNITIDLNNNRKTVFNETVNNNPNVRKGRLKLTYEKNTPENFITNKLELSKTIKDDVYDVVDGNNINQQIVGNNYYALNVFEGILKIANHFLNFKSNSFFSSSPQNSLVTTKNQSLLINQNVSGYNIHNNEDIAYARSMGNKSRLELKCSFNFNQETFNSYSGVTDSCFSNNNLRWTDYSFALAPHFEYRIRNGLTFNVTVPLSLIFIDVYNHTNDNRSPFNRFDSEYKLSLNWNLPIGLKTLWSVGKQIRQGNISNFIDNPVYSTFRRFTTFGSGNLGIKKNNYISTVANYRNVMTGTFASANFMFLNSISDQLEDLNVSKGTIVLENIRTENRNNSINIAGNIGQKLDWIYSTISLNSSFEYMKRNIMRNTVKMNLSLHNFEIGGAINSNPWNNYLILNANFILSRSIQQIEMMNTQSSAMSSKLDISLSSQPVKGLILEFNNHTYRSSMFENQSVISNLADCKATFDCGKCDFELLARNLTNTRNYSFSYILDSNRYSYLYSLRPFEVLLTFKYSF